MAPSARSAKPARKTSAKTPAKPAPKAAKKPAGPKAGKPAAQIKKSGKTIDLYIGSHMWFATPTHIPRMLITEAPGHEVFGEDINLWARDSLSGILLPLHMPPEVEQVFEANKPPILQNCPLSVADWCMQRRLHLESTPPHWKQLYGGLAANKYVVLRNLLPKPVLQLLAMHIRSLQQKGDLFQDPEVEHRSAIVNEPVMHYFHEQLAIYLNRIMLQAPQPESYKASYAYTSIYHEGASLARHTDRPQCKWNMSLVIDTAPEATMETTWPIFLEVNGRPAEVRLLPGDAVLYSGTDLPHWRDTQPPGMETMVSFFHFVPMDFPDDKLFK